ncbi:4-hydroxythreonine-4-phosphate dehydrogenase PdxA [Xanthobacter sp. DSM 24535]|uniref:PdxA family dehydrogenase n=1 Tax=Roseixanthobacter psychrophilus TaxID=3119917 RepID=UPI0037291456
MRRIALAVGDPNGIGPELAVKAAARARAAGRDVVLVADRHVIDDCRTRFGIADDLPVSAVDALPVEAYRPGTLDPRAGAATVAYVREAVRLCEAGEVAGVVACPHSETAINRAGIPFSGYSGLLAELTGTPKERVFLMLVAAGLRIVHATLHESTRAALERLSVDLVVAAGEASAAALRDLGIAQPTLGVFGINPHAGEGGLFGDEDERITRPAVAELAARGIRADGPVGADLLLSQRRHDAYVAMFHDQGHIPIKLLSPLRASALAIGSPVLFTSVAHGCAYDIAGQGVADPTGIEEALALIAGSGPA